MATPTYFSNFPDINYGIKMNKSGIVEKIKIKDYFHLLVPRDDIFRSDTLYSEYVVENGMRPDQVSKKVYGDEQYYWIILHINEITDYFNQWPMSQLQLDDYLIGKYGSIEATNEIHHYETRDVFDIDGNLVLPRGMQVPGDFSFKYPQRPGSGANSFANLASGDVIAVTNRKYEYDLNFEKSRIEVLQSRYIGDWIREVRRYGNFLKSDINVPSINSTADIGDLR